MVNNLNQAPNQLTTLSLFDQCASRAMGTFCSGLSVVVFAPITQKLLVRALATQVTNPVVCGIIATTAIGAFAPSGLQAANQAGGALWSWTKWGVGQGYASLWNRAVAVQNPPIQEEIEMQDNEDFVVVNPAVAENLVNEVEEAVEEFHDAVEDLQEVVENLQEEELFESAAELDQLMQKLN